MPTYRILFKYEMGAARDVKADTPEDAIRKMRESEWDGSMFEIGSWPETGIKEITYIGELPDGYSSQ